MLAKLQLTRNASPSATFARPTGGWLATLAKKVALLMLSRILKVFWPTFFPYTFVMLIYEQRYSGMTQALDLFRTTICHLQKKMLEAEKSSFIALKRLFVSNAKSTSSLVFLYRPFDCSKKALTLKVAHYLLC